MKTVLIVLTVLLLLFFLSGCATQERRLTAEQDAEIGEMYAKCEAVGGCVLAPRKALIELLRQCQGAQI